MKQILRFCEFTGDGVHDWDEVGYKARCQFMGFEHCTLHKKPLGEYEGWRVCCAECTIPIQCKEVK